MSKELIEHLRELSASRKPYATGAHGQIIGMESYRIVANGFAFECIDEAADRIEELELLIAADTGTEGAVANLQGRVEELERVVEFQRKAWTADLAENDALQADNAELVAALSRLTQCAPATVECENMHHRKLDQHSYDKTCHLVSRYAEALCNAQELLAKVRKP